MPRQKSIQELRLCGIEIGQLAEDPTAEEIGEIAKRMGSDDQASVINAIGRDYRGSKASTCYLFLELDEDGLELVRQLAAQLPEAAANV